MQNRTQKTFIWFIFIFSLITLMDCFLFLTFWFATRNGLENGLIFWNTDYSIFYWFSHISYLSCLWIVLWSGFELYSLYNDGKYRPRFIFRFFAIFWIAFTMIGEAPVLPGMMQPRWESMWGILDGTSKFWGVGGFLYSLLDFSQFISIHITIPILAIVYCSIYEYNEVKEGDKNKLIMTMTIFCLSWFFYVGIGTTIGMGSPYPIIDWSGSTDSWSIFVQLLCCVSGLVFILAISTLVFTRVEKIGTNKGQSLNEEVLLENNIDDKELMNV